MRNKAVSSWSLHRTLTAAGASPLLDLPAQLAARGYTHLQLCHFHLPSREAGYLAEFRAALAESKVTLDALLLDAGDLTHPSEADAEQRWIEEWLETGIALGADRARVIAGKAAPAPDAWRASGQRLSGVAAAHPGIRVVTENWFGMVPDADAVLAVLDRAGADVGLLIDLANWTQADKYEQLARIAPRAESCHAKCHFSEDGPDEADFRRTLGILADVGYSGLLTLVYDGPDADEWSMLEREYAMTGDAIER